MDAVAYVSRWENEPEESKANARLITASPDLLQSLNELAEWMRDHTGPSDGTLGMLVRADEAIRKATREGHDD